MGAWWEALTTVQKIFASAAIPATVILVLQTILLLFGVGHFGESDMDADSDADTDGGDHGDIDGIAGLRLFTVRGIVAFFAIGGWFGILISDIGANDAVSILAAVIAGALATLLVALFMKWALKLQDNGNISIENAVGKAATVYLTIPADMESTGKVTLEVQGRFVEMDAVTKEKESIKTGKPVKVIGISNGNILLVENIDE